MAADLAFMVGDLADEIVMDQPDGRTFACLASSGTQVRRLAEEGLVPEYNLSVTVQKSLLVNGVGESDPLELRQKFTLTRSGLKYRIEELTDDPGEAAVTARCVQVTA